MKSLLLLLVIISINNIVGETNVNNDSNVAYNPFAIPIPPQVCVNSKKDIYTTLIRKSNKNFISAYQRYMPKVCNYTVEVVKIVEAYRNAANYVVIFLNKRFSTDEQFAEVVELYNTALNDFNEAIRTLSVTKRLTNECFHSLILMQRAITTTGEGLVAGTIMTYNRQCPNYRVDDAFTHRPIQFDSNYLN